VAHEETTAFQLCNIEVKGAIGTFRIAGKMHGRVQENSTTFPQLRMVHGDVRFLDLSNRLGVFVARAAVCGRCTRLAATVLQSNSGHGADSEAFLKLDFEATRSDRTPIWFLIGLSHGTPDVPSQTPGLPANMPYAVVTFRAFLTRLKKTYARTILVSSFISFSCCC
jgi:hypothetical protein